MEPLFTLATTELRRLLERLLTTDVGLDAFIGDFFPDVKRRIGADADRAAKTELLFEWVDRGVLSGRLRTIYPDAFAYLLMIEKGSDIGHQYPLPRIGTLVIGRGSDADIRFAEQDMKVSRRQVLLTLSGSEVLVERIGKLPIYIEGREVLKPTRFYPGHALEIHQTTLRLHAGSVRASLPPGSDPSVFRGGDQRSDPESMPAAKESANKLFWGLSDRLLDMNRVDEAERMMSHRLHMVLANASLGDAVEVAMASAFLSRALRLALATKKGKWLGWVLEYARHTRFKIVPPMLDDLCRAVSELRPTIGKSLRAYADAQSDAALKSQLEALLSHCPDPADTDEGFDETPQ